MQLRPLIDALEQIAPTRYAQPWDNVGLIVGDPAQDVGDVMLTIDYTPEVACEAAGLNCQAVIAYHPPIFDALKRVTSGGTSSLIHDAIRRGVALYSPHTALDVAPGGTNDVLADALLLTDRRPLAVSQAQSKQYKLVTFVPEEALGKVSDALFAAGAGRIGRYSSCSFRSPGTGTFFGEEGTRPAVGEAGKLEEAQEMRIETIVPIERVSDVIAALRSSHPYEEPAFDLLQLAAPPEGLGLGRVGSFAEPIERSVLIARLKRELSIAHVLVAGPTSGLVRRVAVCAGACGNLLDDALKEKAELYITGEMRHHDALKAARAGLTVICTLHSNSERAVLKRLADRLRWALPDIKFHLSKQDRDPFEVR